MTPHVCPKCDGLRVIKRQFGDVTLLHDAVCPVCKGDGVLWEPEPIQSEIPLDKNCRAE